MGIKRSSHQELDSSPLPAEPTGSITETKLFHPDLVLTCKNQIPRWLFEDQRKIIKGNWGAQKIIVRTALSFRYPRNPRLGSLWCRKPARAVTLQYPGPGTWPPSPPREQTATQGPLLPLQALRAGVGRVHLTDDRAHTGTLPQRWLQKRHASFLKTGLGVWGATKTYGAVQTWSVVPESTCASCLISGSKLPLVLGSNRLESWKPRIWGPEEAGGVTDSDYTPSRPDPHLHLCSVHVFRFVSSFLLSLHESTSTCRMPALCQALF